MGAGAALVWLAADCAGGPVALGTAAANSTHAHRAWSRLDTCIPPRAEVARPAGMAVWWSARLALGGGAGLLLRLQIGGVLVLFNRAVH